MSQRRGRKHHNLHFEADVHPTHCEDHRAGGWATAHSTSLPIRGGSLTKTPSQVLGRIEAGETHPPTWTIVAPWHSETDSRNTGTDDTQRQTNSRVKAAGVQLGQTGREERF